MYSKESIERVAARVIELIDKREEERKQTEARVARHLEETIKQVEEQRRNTEAREKEAQHQVFIDRQRKAEERQHECMHNNKHFTPWRKCTHTTAQGHSSIHELSYEVARCARCFKQYGKWRV